MRYKLKKVLSKNYAIPRVRDSKGHPPNGGWVPRIATGDLEDGTPA